MKIKMDNEEKVTPDELKKLQKINKYFDIIVFNKLIKIRRFIFS